MKPSKHPPRIHIIPFIGNLDKVKGAGFDADGELIGTPRRGPAHAHGPAMEVAAEGEVGVGQAFADKVVADAGNADVPFFGQLDVAPHIDGVGGDG